MCCIFTCCGWMIDLVQRLWTFTMSCCISSAVCCSFVTAAMSGIALGYNYSLAEYIDLKETNVSVYIKRGVFDDEVGDDTDWRRSGHLPIAGHIGEKNLITGPPEEDDSLALRSGRRLDDSVFESNDRNRFEGSLMKLTARVPYTTSTTTGVTSDLEMAEVISKYPQGSIDQLKAIQSLINMRKSGDPRGPTTTEKPKSSTYGIDERYLPHFPAYPEPMEGGRRRMPYSSLYATPSPPNAARQAVPDVSIIEPAKWRLPKLPPGEANRVVYGDYAARFTYPPPVTPRPGPVRPPKATIGVFRGRPTPTTLKVVKTTPKTIDMDIPKSIDRGLEEFKEKLALGKYEPEIRDEEFLKMPKGGPIKTEEDYEEDIKGLPVRRRRQVDSIKTHNNKTNERTTKNEFILNPKIASIRNIKAYDIKTSTLVSKIIPVTRKLEKVSAVSDIRSINVASKEVVDIQKSYSDTSKDQQINLKVNDIERSTFINKILVKSSILPEKPADTSISALETVYVASKQATDELHSSTKMNTHQKIYVEANNIETSTSSNKKPENPADTVILDVKTVKNTRIKGVDNLKSKSEINSEQKINLNGNNIETSTFIDKLLVISSKLSKLSADKTAVQSKMMSVVLKQATDKGQSIMANDITLGKLSLPTGIILN